MNVCWSGVLGLLARAEHVPAEREHRPVMAVVEHLEGALRPGAHVLGETLVGRQAEQGGDLHPAKHLEASDFHNHPTGQVATSEIAVRDHAREEALDLRRRERRGEQVLAARGSSGTGGRCSASAGRGPTSRARRHRRGPSRTARPARPARRSTRSCRISGYGSSRWAPSARIRPGSESTISDSRDRFAREPLQRALDRRRGAPHRPVQPRAAAPAAEPPAEILGGDVRGVERLADLRLQPGLLVQADLEVGQQRELGAGLRVGLGSERLVARERGPQHVRLARPPGSARTRSRSPRTPSGCRARRRRWPARSRRTACAAGP